MKNAKGRIEKLEKQVDAESITATVEDGQRRINRALSEPEESRSPPLFPSRDASCGA
jgi:hypothetical protein